MIFSNTNGMLIDLTQVDTWNVFVQLALLFYRIYHHSVKNMREPAERILEKPIPRSKQV